MEENVITYETFRKFQRKERESENLQELPEDFFKSCAEWIKRKARAYEETKDLMIQREIENVLGIIKDILDRRERKLLLLAMHTVRSNVVPKNLHPYEEECFDKVVESLRGMRERILKVIKGESEETEEKEEGQKASSTEKPPEKKEEPEKKEVEAKEIKDFVEEGSAPENEEGEEAGAEVKEEGNEPKIVEPPGCKLVKILSEVPKFLGVDGREYGPFKPNDIVTLEKEVAEILVKGNKAEFLLKGESREN